MKTQRHLRVLAFVLALVMVFTAAPAFAATERQKPAFTSPFQSMEDVLQNSLQALNNKAGYQPEDEVVFLVELSQKPILEIKTKSLIVSDYIKTSAGTAALSRIEKEQDTALSVISRKYAQDMEVLYRYNTVFNGFSVKAEYGKKAELEALPGVKSVSVARTYSYVEPVDGYEEVATATSGGMLNSDKANSEGYTGKGTVTAVLDTGLDTDHEAFKQAPQEPKFNLQTIEAFVAKEGHKAEAAAADLYKSDKIPFAYDYAGKDTTVSGGESHGTHVAGTVGANIDKFTGVAPDTQIVAMKVFDDQGGGATDAVILAALEDAVLLNVDTINMSLGTPSGFTKEKTEVDQAYENIKNAGINLMCAVGNDTSSTSNNLLGTDLALLANPDTGIAGSPSTYGPAVSVASVNETVVRNDYFLGGSSSRKILYTDASEDPSLMWKSLSGTFSYVAVPNYGNTVDFAAAGDLHGKVALVMRGDLNFTVKEKNAADAGAKALIVYDNQDEPLIHMQSGGLIPMIFISKEDGEYLARQVGDNKTVTLSPDYVDVQPQTDGGRMSSFSSLGVAPDLTLKPEITAPGGGVWSTLPGNLYGSMDGTSMATPHMAGAASVVRQYVNEKYGDRSATEKEALVTNLLLSTATQVLDQYNVPYSPRKQGAGLANVWNAISGEAYLSVKGSDRPQAELGYNEQGAFTFTFTVHNLAESAQTYDVSVLPLTAKTETVTVEESEEYAAGTYECISELSRLLEDSELQVELSQTSVTVQGGQTADVTVKLTLTEAGKTALKDFVNGTFLDGFVVLDNRAEDGVNLSLPYLGFYGDWAKVPVFDSTLYDDKDAFMHDTELLVAGVNTAGNVVGLPMGINLLMQDEEGNFLDDKYESDKNFYPADYAVLGYTVIPATGLLRAPKRLEYQVHEGDQVTPLAYYENAMKSFYSVNNGYRYYDLPHPRYGFGPIESGDYQWDMRTDHNFSFDLVATVDGTGGKTQTLSIPFGYDVTLPEVVSVEFFTKAVEAEGGSEDVPYAKVTVRDNNFVMGVQLVTHNKKEMNEQTGLFEVIPLSDIYTDESVTQRGQNYVFEIPLDVAQFAGAALGEDVFDVTVYDYALNEYVSKPYPISGVAGAAEVRINNRNITASVWAGPMTIGAYVLPETYKDSDVTWTTDNEKIITKIDDLGYDKSTGLHNARITFGGEPGTVHLTASSGAASDTIEILVNASTYQPGSDWTGEIRYSGVWEIPENYKGEIKVMLDLDNPGIEPYAVLVGHPNNTAENPYTCHVTVSKDGATVTLRNWHSRADAESSIKFTGTENENYLILQNENSIVVPNYGAGIEVPKDVNLTVQTDSVVGKLDLDLDSGDHSMFPMGAPSAGAGIGGKYVNSYTESDHIAGNITIESGEINIHAFGAQGAGIGGASKGIAQSITLKTGATVNMNLELNPSSYMIAGPAGIGSGTDPVNLLGLENYQMDILIDGATITGTTITPGAMIGIGYTQMNKDMFKTVITINSGVLELTGNAPTNYSAALIGSGYNMYGADIVINGGLVTANQTVSTRSSAIGLGDGRSNVENHVGSITINGGTITATVPSGSMTDAIGKGSVTSTNPPVVTIDGASVKARAGEDNTPSISGTVKNNEETQVYEVRLEIDNPPKIMTIDGEPFPISGPHYGEPNAIYPWLAPGKYEIKIQDVDNDWHYFEVTVNDGGTFETKTLYEVGVTASYLTPTSEDIELVLDETRNNDGDIPQDVYVGSHVEAGSTVHIKLTPDENYILPKMGTQQIRVFTDGLETFDYELDSETGIVTLKNISGDTYLVVLATVDKTELWNLLLEAAALKKEDYEDDDAWAYFVYVNGYASGVYYDDTATGAEVTGAIAVLKKAMGDLHKKQLDTAALQAAVARATALHGEDYDPELWQEVEEALANAQAVLGKTDATQSQVNDATAWLEDALAALGAATNKDELRKQIGIAEALTEDEYVSTTWSALSEALAAAKTVEADDTAAQGAVNAAADALREAIAALVKRGDKTALNAEIAKESTFTADDYTETSWKAYQAELNKAKAVAADPDATQIAVDAAVESLAKAREALVKRGDKTALNAEIAKSEGLNAEDYTSATWKAYQDALAKAKAVAADGDALQAAVDAAAEALTKAREALVKRGDKTALNAEIAKSEGLKAEDYTDATWKAYQDALTKAKAVAADADALQDAVDAAAEALKGAREALEKAPKPAPADKTALNAEIAKGEKLASKDYTDATWKAYQDALAKAKAVTADADATQEAVDAAADALMKARQGLKKPVAPDDPATGDSFPAALVVALLLVSAAGLCVTVLLPRKKTAR